MVQVPTHAMGQVHGGPSRAGVGQVGQAGVDQQQQQLVRKTTKNHQLWEVLLLSREHWLGCRKTGQQMIQAQAGLWVREMHLLLLLLLLLLDANSSRRSRVQQQQQGMFQGTRSSRRTKSSSSSSRRVLLTRPLTKGMVLSSSRSSRLLPPLPRQKNASSSNSSSSNPRRKEPRRGNPCRLCRSHLLLLLLAAALAGWQLQQQQATMHPTSPDPVSSPRCSSWLQTPSPSCCRPLSRRCVATVAVLLLALLPAHHQQMVSCQRCAQLSLLLSLLLVARRRCHNWQRRPAAASLSPSPGFTVKKSIPR